MKYTTAACSDKQARPDLTYMLKAAAALRNLYAFDPFIRYRDMPTSGEPGSGR
jgi:hypothetical protein